MDYSYVSAPTALTHGLLITNRTLIKHLPIPTILPILKAIIINYMTISCHMPLTYTF